MKDDSPLPVPKNLSGISRLFSENRIISSISPTSLPTSDVLKLIHNLERGEPAPVGTLDFDKMNAYFLYRSLNQANEACNKLWATLELYRGLMNSRPSFKRFREEFLSSTSIPSLHYANMSALLSILSLFGISTWIKKGQKLRYFYILRTEAGVEMRQRTVYMVKAFGSCSTGWHKQLIQTYEGLSRLGVCLPAIDTSRSKGLLDERNKVQYDILGQTSMKGMPGTSVYASHLEDVSRNLDAAIKCLEDVIQPLPGGLHSRFRSLISFVPHIVKQWSAKTA